MKDKALSIMLDYFFEKVIAEYKLNNFLEAWGDYINLDVKDWNDYTNLDREKLNHLDNLEEIRANFKELEDDFKKAKAVFEAIKAEFMSLFSLTEEEITRYFEHHKTERRCYRHYLVDLGEENV